MISRVTVAALCCRIPVLLESNRCLCTIKNHSCTFLRRRAWQIPRKNFMERRKNETKLTFWNQLFGKYLLTTNTVSSGILMVFGDWMAQLIEMRRHRKDKKEASIDYRRIWRMFIVGTVFGPLHHYAYNWMELFMPVATIRNTTKKILLDQLIMSPVCILVFFYSACFLESKSLDETNEELKEKFIYVYVTDWGFWPAVQFINFQYLNIKYRVTFVNVCTAFYNIFMSYMKHDFDLDI